VRYRAAKASDGDLSPHDLVPTKLAAAIWDIVSKFKSTIPDYPQKETCELLILDRSVDQVYLSVRKKISCHTLKLVWLIHFIIQGVCHFYG
jgi:hypothetical protein